MIRRYLAIASSLASLYSLPIVAVAAEPISEHEHASEPVPEVVRQLLTQARAALNKGDAAAAAEWFERAAARGENTEAEIGEVRARLLAGQFRHALTNANVVAVEHPDSAVAQGLLAYIDDRTGYTAQALERLHQAQRTHPDAVAPVAVEAEILIDRRAAPRAIELLDHWQQQHGPHPDLGRLRARAALVLNDVDGYRRWQAATATATTAATLTTDWPPAAAPKFPFDTSAATTHGNGLVIDQGQRVLTLRRLIPASATAIWVRNARGELRRAHLTNDAPMRDSPMRDSPMRDNKDSSELALLSLNEPFTATHSLAMDSMAPLATSGLCFALGFPASRSADAMQPAVTPCVLIGGNAPAKALRINVPLAPGDDGSPVFDSSGRLLGLVDSASDPTADNSPPRSSPGTTVRYHAVTATTSVQRPSPFPEIYERLAPSVVQIVTASSAKDASLHE